MSLVFERIQTEGIAELSYLLGDDDEGIAAVFDPTPDVDKYIEMARDKNVSISHIFETHIHADLVSGARELCDRVQSAKVFVSHEEDAKYGFDHEKLADGDQFTFGKTIVTVRHTPGHTPGVALVCCARPTGRYLQSSGVCPRRVYDAQTARRKFNLFVVNQLAVFVVFERVGILAHAFVHSAHRF